MTDQAKQPANAAGRPLPASTGAGGSRAALTDAKDLAELLRSWHAEDCPAAGLPKRERMHCTCGATGAARKVDALAAERDEAIRERDFWRGMIDECHEDFDGDTSTYEAGYMPVGWWSRINAALRGEEAGR